MRANKNETGVEAYPLAWPDTWPRAKERERNNRFRTGFGVVRDSLVTELTRMGATGVIISTNVPLMARGVKAGLPYANFKEPDDPGVAVYFKLDGDQHVVACDKWLTVCENMNAMLKTVNALRGIERWGATEILKKAFSGFKALPSPEIEPWWQVLGVSKEASGPEIERAFKQKIRENHPDLAKDETERPWREEQTRKITWAIDEARRVMS